MPSVWVEAKDAVRIKSVAGRPATRSFGRSLTWSGSCATTTVRVVVVFLAIFIPGISVIPVVLIYVLLGYLLPEADEF